MKILLIGDYLPHEHESVSRFAEALARGFEARGESVVVLRPECRFGRPKSKSPGWKRQLARLGYIDKYVLFPPRLRRVAQAFDIVHILDQQDAVYVRFVEDAPHLVTCHDLIALRAALGEIPEERAGLLARIRQRAILKGLNRARRIVCISETTKADLLRLSNHRPEAVGVVYNGLNYPYTPMDSRESAVRLAPLGLLACAHFYLHVGNDVFYKNRAGLLRIFGALRRIEGFGTARLVLVGKPLTSETVAVLREENLEESVLQLGAVANEDLRALYSRSAGLIFPSLYEGFGWPPLEAMACGCPVFTSNRPPMTEVGGAAARYFDPERPAEAAALIASAAPERALMAEAGLARARRFTTEAMIEGYLAAYRAAIREARGCDPLT